MYCKLCGARVDDSPAGLCRVAHAQLIRAGDVSDLSDSGFTAIPIREVALQYDQYDRRTLPSSGREERDAV